MAYDILFCDGDRISSGDYPDLGAARAALDEIDRVQPFTYYAKDRVSGERYLSFAATSALRLQRRAPADWFAARDHEREPNADLSDVQIHAVLAFAEKSGRGWRDAMMRCWERATYPGMSADHGAALQAMRDQFGPEWLVNAQLVDLAHTLDARRREVTA